MQTLLVAVKLDPILGAKEAEPLAHIVALKLERLCVQRIWLMRELIIELKLVARLWSTSASLNVGRR